MNSGATIFDDAEIVELLRDHPHLLAIADAVRTTQSEEARLPGRRKMLLVAALSTACCAAVAGLIAFLAVPSGSSHHIAARGGTTHPQAAGRGPISSPIATGGSNVRGMPAVVELNKAMSDALKSFGEPLILPDTPLLKPSDAEPTAFEQSCAATPVAPASMCQVSVQFPSPSVGIQYTPTASTYWGSHYPDAATQYQAEIEKSSNPRDQIVYLSGTTPALIDPEATGIGIEFRLGKLSISIWAPDNNGTSTTVDATALQALAQSMVDQAENS